jgi:DNA-binding MarR family transcriptional regulator
LALVTDSSEQLASDAQIHGRVASTLRRADLAMLAVKERPLRKIGTSGSLYAVLVNLHMNPGQTGAELARAVGVTPQAIQPLVNKLVERGLVEKRVHARHTSVQELHLTDEGRKETARADHVMAHLDEHLRHNLGDPDYQKLADLLAKVIECLPAWAPPAAD